MANTKKTRPFLIVGNIAPSVTYDTVTASRLVSASPAALIDRCKTGELRHTKSQGGRYLVKGEDLILFAEADALARQELVRQAVQEKIEKQRQRQQEQNKNAPMNLEMPQTKTGGIKSSLLAEIERLRAMVAMLPD